MARVPVPAARATLTESSEGLLITIRAGTWYAIPFFGFWLAMWRFGEIIATREIIFGHSHNVSHLSAREEFDGKLFLVAWLALWSVGGTFAIISLLWNLAGVEKVLRGPSILTTKREVLGIGPVREYELRSVSNLRISANPRSPSNRISPFQLLNGGIIAFDYGAKTFRFGIGLHEPEAQQIIDRLKSHNTF